MDCETLSRRPSPAPYTGLITQLTALKSLNLTLELVSTRHSGRCEKIISMAAKI